jgi:hypothetical protein
MLAPDEANIHFQLARIYEQLGRTAPARSSRPPAAQRDARQGQTP